MTAWPLAGQTIVVTGATSGVGLAASVKLAERGASLVLVGRDAARGEAALATVTPSLAPSARARFVAADLAETRAAAQAAAAIAESEPRIDALLNNAGAMFERRETTAEGRERTFALNHLAYMAVTLGLLPRLREAGGRVVSVASRAHEGVALDWSDLELARRYNGWSAYRRSKLCNLLFTAELARRETAAGVLAVALHPGFVASRFGDEAGPFVSRIIRVAKAVAAMSPQAAAETPVFLLSEPRERLVPGGYYAAKRRLEPSRAATDAAAAARLWAASLPLLVPA